MVFSRFTQMASCLMDGALTFRSELSVILMSLRWASMDHTFEPKLPDPLADRLDLYPVAGGEQHRVLGVPAVNVEALHARGLPNSQRDGVSLEL